METKIIVIFGVIIHIILFSAVFKIYFASPLEHGMVPHKAGGVPPAKRLVLIVADGLRAQSLYNNQFEFRAPFLHARVKSDAAWGVAHTRLPTESRPGHVAILAGFNEDPGAITKGWRSNPVEYDSVINQSTNAFCWGSPDIVKLFVHDKSPHIRLSYYSPEIQDFSGKDATELLDKWVFNKVYNFIKQQKVAFCTSFCENGNIIFLHLLGLDTAGHSHTPLSKKYAENIEVVDAGVHYMSELINDFFGDNGTAYIFTSDHGMTNWGSHGDGSEHETSVPFIAWGAGIEPHNMRQDIQQGDTASLIASLLGINIPVHSNGVVPLNYIKTTTQQKAKILFSNAAQLLEQYMMKYKKLERQTVPFLFGDFSGLAVTEALEIMDNSSKLMNESQYLESIATSYSLIRECQLGINHYKTYFRGILLKVNGIGYLGWIVFVFTCISDLETWEYEGAMNRVSYTRYFIFDHSGFIFGGLTTFITLVIYILDLDRSFYLYFMFPVITWYAVVRNFKNGAALISMLYNCAWYNLFIQGLMYFAGIQLLVYTFYEPTGLLFLFLLLAVESWWFHQNNYRIYWKWIICQGLFGLAPILTGIQSGFSKILQTLAMIGWIIVVMNIKKRMGYIPNKKVVWAQIYLLILAFMNTIIVDLTISYGLGLCLPNKCLSWIIFIISPILPLFISSPPGLRCASAMIGFVTMYTLMSTGCESIFMLLFTIHMYHWHVNESYFNRRSALPVYLRYQRHIPRYTTENTVRQCFLLLCFIMLGFFGVGNMASLSSFNPTWVRCFITIFSPKSMAVLILIKLMLPFLIVLIAFRSVVQVSYFQIRNCFFIILLFCSIMVLEFFYLIKDEGSWLEMGLSFSRFIVAVVTTLAIIVLYGITGIYNINK